MHSGWCSWNSVCLCCSQEISHPVTLLQGSVAPCPQSHTQSPCCCLWPNHPLVSSCSCSIQSRFPTLDFFALQARFACRNLLLAFRGPSLCHIFSYKRMISLCDYISLFLLVNHPQITYRSALRQTSLLQQWMLLMCCRMWFKNHTEQ